MADNQVSDYLSEEREIVTKEDIHLLLIHYGRTNHRIKNADIKGETIMERCILLYSLDYQCTLVPNLSGELCSHYPMKLIIPEYEKDPNSSSHVQSRHCQILLYQMIKNARCARCRTRFVIPAILFKGKYICRSATLSGGAEMFGRSTTDYLLSNENPPFLQGAYDNGKVDMYDKFRGHDIQLLKYFDVKYICDLMVEKKKTKFGMPVTSSEKVDKESRYSDFAILGMPYPGCEFFKEWKESNYLGESVQYDWRQALNNSALDLPMTPLVTELDIDWSKYKEWSFTKLTQNYLKLLLNCIVKGSSGLLIHCVSGWDRTPLFVSLLRISLWADGVIHTSLSATELLYLTLGYDWYLFGHDLPTRLGDGEEVMLFCFKVLRDIASEEFSLAPRPSPVPAANEVTSTPSRENMNATATHQRVDSDSSFGIQGVLLDDAMMNFQGKGSTSSLNSLGSSEAQDPIRFTIGIPEEQQDKDGIYKEGEDEIAALRRNASSSSFPQKKRSMSPSTRMSPSLRCSSPVTSGLSRRRSSDSQALSLHSNHFMGSPVIQSSSPVIVPQRSEEGSSTHGSSHNQSVGSWQIIPSMEGLRTDSHCSTERSNSIQEAEINMMSTVRWQRLDEVSRLFQNVYFAACPSQTRSNSVGAGLSSIFDRIADSIVSFRGGAGPPGNARRGV